MADRICTRINAPASQCREHNLHCGAPRCFAPAPMPNDTLTAVERVIDELDALADIWAAETNIAAFAAQIASAPHAEKRAEAIRAMMHLSFVEGAYRLALAKQARPEPVNDLPAPPGPATITPSPTGGNP